MCIGPDSAFIDLGAHLCVTDGNVRVMSVACVLQPCQLYLNEKPPTQYLFTAAAALYALTGKAYYRGDADVMWPKGTAETTVQRTFLYNWNNVLAQGTIILAAQPDLPGMLRSRDFYRNYLRATAELWSRCSNDGEAIANYYRFCECAFPPPRNQFWVTGPI